MNDFTSKLCLFGTKFEAVVLMLGKIVMEVCYREFDKKSLKRRNLPSVR